MINYFFEIITEWKSILITNIMDIIKWHSSFYFIIHDSARDFTCRHTYVCRFNFIIILVWFYSLWCLLIPWGSKERGWFRKNSQYMTNKGRGRYKISRTHFPWTRDFQSKNNQQGPCNLDFCLYISIVKLYCNSKKIFSKFQYTFHKKNTRDFGIWDWG